MSLEVGADAFFTLLGPSGRGRTTLLPHIAGFDHPDAGAIRRDGLADRGPAQLSGDRQQRVALALARALPPAPRRRPLPLRRAAGERLL